MPQADGVTIEPSFADWLEGRQPPVRPAPLTRLALDDPDRAWLVAAGAVDLFAILADDDTGGGTRHHLFRAGPGCLLFGLQDALDLVSLSLQPGPGTVLLPVGPAALSEIEPGSRVARELADALDRWIAGLSEALVKPIARRPRPSTLVAAGDRAVIGQGACLGTRADTLWLRLPEAAGTLADLELVPAAPATAIPLTRATWLKLGAETEVTVLRTADLVGAGTWQTELAGFHGAVMNALTVNLRLTDVDQAHRIAGRTARQLREIDRMVAEVASLGGLAAPRARVADTAEELFSAMTEIGRALHAPIRRPIKLRQADADVPPTLDEIIAASGLRARRVRLADRWWREDGGTLLCRRIDGQRPVAVVRRFGGYRLFDPRTARWSRLDGRTAAELEPQASTFFRPFPDRKLSFSQLVTFGSDLCTADLATVTLVSLAGTLLGAGLPTATAFLLNAVIPGRLTDLLVQVGLAILLLAMGMTVFTVVAGRAAQRIQARAGAETKAAVWDRILRLPNSVLVRYAAGDLAARAACLEVMLGGVRGALNVLTMAAVTGLSALLILFGLEWRTGLLAVGTVAVLGLATWLAAVAQDRAYAGGEAVEGLVASFVIEMLTGIAKIRLAGAESRAFVRWGQRYTRLRAKLIAARRVQNGYAAFLAGFEVLKLAGVFTVVAMLTDAAAVPPGTFVAVLVAFGMTTAAAAQAAQVLLGLDFLLLGIPYAEPLLTQTPEAPGTKASPGTLTGACEMTGVTFRYGPDQPPVLAGVSLRVAPGEFVAVVGPSGCGKSTLVRLLLGFEKPAAGQIAFDDRDLQGLDVDAVRRQIGTVLQGAKLMPGSIFENIRGAADASLDDAWAAAELAGIAADIRSMPMGMHTLITDAGRQFSGGQVQRLAIARAVVSRPPILIFDEATSALDNRAQAHVTQALSRLAATRIVVAHRLSTIAGADRILVLDQGRIVEQGTFPELLARNGLFTRLARRQMA